MDNPNNDSPKNGKYYLRKCREHRKNIEQNSQSAELRRILNILREIISTNK